MCYADNPPPPGSRCQWTPPAMATARLKITAWEERQTILTGWVPLWHDFNWSQVSRIREWWWQGTILVHYLYVVGGPVDWHWSDGTTQDVGGAGDRISLQHQEVGHVEQLWRLTRRCRPSDCGVEHHYNDYIPHNWALLTTHVYF